MSHRRTMGATILSESVSSPSVASPLRRRSLAVPQQTIVQKELIQNDDESERLARRRQEATLNSSRTVENTERRVSLGLVGGLSAAEITEHYNKCLRLCAENKINSKNVFALSMIDFMAVLNKRDQSSNNMQTAGTTLDVSTKIYSLRVDCVYGDAFKMAGEKQKLDKPKEGGEEEAEDAANTSNAAESGTKRKKKRRIQKILCSAESLESEVEDAFLSANKNDNDSQTNDMLLQIRFPIHTVSRCGLHPYEDVLFDNPIVEENEGENIDSEVEITELEDFKELEISPILNFDFLGWSEDDIPDHPSPEQNGVNDEPGEHRFDINASLLDTCDNDNAGMNYFDLDDGSQENIDRCGRIGRDEPDRIVDFCESVVEKDTTEVPEYSYLQKSMNNLHWAGPIHWKPRLIPKAASSSKVVGACRQEGARKKREVAVDQTREATRDFFDKLEGKIPRKLQSRTLRQSWQEDKITLPEDVHYDSANPTRYYFQSSMRKLLHAEKRPDVVAEGGGEGGEVAIDDDGTDYNYNNLNDTLDYCSQNRESGEIEGANNSANLFHQTDGEGQKENENPCQNDNYMQGFTEDNLIAAPKATTQTQIQYATKAKKIDMRQLKRSIWKALTTENLKEKEVELANESNRVLQIDEMRNFTTVYKELPKLLGKESAEALSLPLAFASLLHLANEKNLGIKSASDLSDFKITQD